MANMAEGLSGTQSRKLFSTIDSTRRTIKRVDPRLLEGDAEDLRLRDVEVLVREFRRVVAALNEFGGFDDETG
jgi:hypothetical protein